MESQDLTALALCDVLRLNGMTSKIIIPLEIESIAANTGTLWFYISVPRWGRKGGDKIPEGLKILFNTSRMPYMMCESKVMIYDHISTPIHIRKTDLSRHVVLCERWERQIFHRWLKNSRADWIFEYNPHNCDFWRSKGVKSVFVPLGYHEKFELRPKNLGDKSAISFIGRLHHMRRRIMVRMLENLGIDLRHVRDPLKRGLISQYAVSLHVGAFDDFHIYPDLRMSLLASNGCLIVSELCDWTPFHDDEWVECEYDDIPRACQDALSGKFEGMEEKSTRLYKERFRFRDHIEGALRIIGVL